MSCSTLKDDKYIYQNKSDFPANKYAITYQIYPLLIFNFTLYEQRECLNIFFFSHKITFEYRFIIVTS